MQAFSFYGSSDDLFMMKIDGIDHEEIYPPKQYLIEREQFDDKLVINAHYGIRAGVWSIGVEPWDENEKIPNWPMGFTIAENRYSSELIINVPDDTTFRVING